MDVIKSFDTVSSLSSGITNAIKDVLGLAIIIISYQWLVDHLSFFEIESSVALYIITFIGLDFAGYWSHRFEHEINLFWNRHIIHHSSEEFNLACALRQNVSAVFNVFFFLLIPIAILGVPAKIVATVAPLHLFAQFWYHTRLIHRMGWLEYVIVTPSHHRVHHAINDIYLDKNYSQVFIFWDRIFGTFQEELASEIPVYGVKKQVATWNPFIINFQHLWILLTDAFYTEKWLDKIKVFYKQTGWRPADRIKSDPIKYTENAKEQVKYNTEGSLLMHTWIWAQLVIHIVLMIYLFQHLDQYSFMEMMLYGCFLFVSVFSYTSLMDKSWLSVASETLKLMLGIFCIYYFDGWFGIDNIVFLGSYIIVGYLITSWIFNYYFLNEKLGNTSFL